MRPIDLTLEMTHTPLEAILKPAAPPTTESAGLTTRCVFGFWLRPYSPSSFRYKIYHNPAPVDYHVQTCSVLALLHSTTLIEGTSIHPRASKSSAIPRQCRFVCPKENIYSVSLEPESSRVDSEPLECGYEQVTCKYELVTLFLGNKSHIVQP